MVERLFKMMGTLHGLKSNMAEWIITLFLLLNGVVFCDARYWFKRPGTVYACPGDNVQFLWQYDPQINDVAMILWRSLNTGRTVAGHHFRPVDKVVFYYPTYAERVTLADPDEANAGLVLKSITSEDAGEYKVELLESGLSDTAELIIIQEQDLVTTITVDDEQISSGAKLNKYQQQTITINVHTNSVINGTIILAMTGQRSKACMTQRSCSMTFDLDTDDDLPSLRTLTASVYYGACKPREHVIYVDTAMPVTTTADPNNPRTYVPESNTGLHPGSIAAIVLGVILFLFIAIVLLLWGIFYRKQSTGYALEPWQRKYYNFKVFTPLRNSCRKDDDKSSRHSSRRAPLSLGPKSDTREAYESTRSLNKALNRTLTVEDITVVREFEPKREDSLDGPDGQSAKLMTGSNDQDTFDDDESSGEHMEDSDFETTHNTSVPGPDHDISDPRITSMQYSEMDDSNASSRFV